MVVRSYKLFLFAFLLVFTILVSLSFVSAWVDCWEYSGWAGGTETTCETDHPNDCRWETTSTDAWCESPDGCCMMKGCMEFDGNETGCTDSSINGGYNCTWDPYMTMWYPNGTQGPSGGCMMDFSDDGGMVWGGMSEGCWNNDGNKFACDADNSCSWKSNDANQNPWCWIKTLFDAQAQNSFATTSDIGCCDMKGCWDYDGTNESVCQNESAFAGLCTWVTKANDPWCPNDVGCCMMKWCGEITDEENCTKMKTDLMMPCKWENDACTDEAGGGFIAFNDTDSCMGTGGWWNASGDCEMPDFDLFGGGGGFMFADEAHCWFADNQPALCGNISGCVYCNDTGTHGANGSASIGAKSGTNNVSSACYKNPVGFCQGHQSAWITGAGVLVSDIATDSLNCVDIQIRSACNYGPLPNCVWNSTANLTGPYCAAGTSTIAKSVPPVGFCEHPDAISNYTLCMELKEQYMMPCKWGNASSNKTLSDNCTFNSNAVFGGITGEEKEFEIIGSEYSCIAAGGTWKTEMYLESGSLKQDKWCEKGAMFNLVTGIAAANKGNCDTDCWACEFQVNGTIWPNVANASSACIGSALDYCRWTNDTSAPNGLGWCDYPDEMSYGAGDCQTNCKDCGLMSDPYDSCINSVAGCKWVNNTDSVTNSTKVAAGVCVDTSKKVCDTDCFSCYDFSSCNSSSIDCSWDNHNFLCTPASFDGEICTNANDDGFAIDDDGDGMANCADPDCSFDMACGGSSFGDCAQYDNDMASCVDAIAFGTQNCTWINFTWEDVGHCGMPGEDCWQYDNNMTLCGLTDGCTNASTMSFDNFCDINMTKSEDLNCWQYTTEGACNGATESDDIDPNCTWVSSEWGGEYGGWCDYWLFAQCMNKNQTTCVADGNCTWNTQWSDEGMCDVACFNHSLDSESCIDGVLNDVCEWRDTSDSMCFPSTFEMMGGMTGGKSGCAQYDGNYTACLLNNYTCVWHNDSSIDNNVSGGGDADGWCDPKGEYELIGEMKGDMIFLGMDSGNSLGVAAESGIHDVVDILGFGMRVTDNSYGFGMGTYNITDAAYCNSYPISIERPGGSTETVASASGLNTTKFYWYLDTDGVTTGGCSAISTGGTTTAGFEFYISHVVRNNTNTNSQLQTTKQLYKCNQNSSGGFYWVSTNVFISDNKKFTCHSSQKGAAFVAVEKTTLENFPEFNITTPMRIIGASANATYNRTTPLDSVGPGYYTPGTIDFKFVDCSNPDIKDPKCKNFQKFGVNMFEDCKNGVDDDGDGLADCSDPKCIFTPVCASGTAFDFTSGTNDNQAPIVVFSKVDKMADAAIISFDTDKPANGTLMFYNQSANCVALNETLYDVGDDSFTFDDYKPFHRITLDSGSIGYDLINSTIYYYKVKVCDHFDNCGTSVCLNFTTRKANKNFIFRMDLPVGFTVDIPALDYSGNFTYANATLLGAGVVKDIGIKTNSSLTKNMNITVNYSDMSLKFIGVDLYKPKSLDLEDAFIIDLANDVLGMNSSTKSWNVLLSDMGLGGSGDSIELDFPVTYNVNNSLMWHQDNMTGSGNDVDAYSNCSAGGSGTVCKIPTSLGFSVYQISVPSSTAVTTTTSGGTSSGNVTTIWTNTFVVNDEQFKEGYVKDISVNERMKIIIDGEDHYVGVKEIKETTVKIEVASDPVEATLIIGDTRRFDVTDDGYYDVAVTLNSIADNKVNIKIISIYEEVTAETIAEEEEKEKDAIEESERDSLTWLWIVIGVVVLVAIIGGGIAFKKSRRK